MENVTFTSEVAPPAIHVPEVTKQVHDLTPDTSEGGKKREILLYPDKRLREHSVHVINAAGNEPRVEGCIRIGEGTQQLVKDLIATAKATKAAGLAAPQIGALKRVVVIEVNGEGSSEFRALINPVILGNGGVEEWFKEGCLSFPKALENVKRPNSVWGTAITVEGKKWHWSFTGHEAQAIQHEVEHLDGILLIDKVPFHRKTTLSTKMKQMIRRLHTLQKLQKNHPPYSSLIFGYQVDED